MLGESGTSQKDWYPHPKSGLRLGRPNVDVNGGKPPPSAPGFMRC
jgi:hypothetical protein